MNAREKEQYLREYSLLKSQGKPFFPYAVAKDALMAVVVMIVIILMSIILGAELGPKADPTTTTYVPRPEWYFFFLFELLRVIKPADLTPLATIGVPTICLVLLILLPFYDRGPERRPERRPIATTAGILTIIAIGYLTYLGASAGSPNEIDMKVAPQYEAGKLVVAQSGCLACHKIGENGGQIGPDLTDVGDYLRPAAIRRTLENPTAPMPSFASLDEEKKSAMVDFLATLKGGDEVVDGEWGAAVAGAAAGTLEEGQVRAMFDRISGFYDVMNSVMTAGLHHRWRERAADLAALHPGDRALDVATGTGDLALELARRVGPAGEVVGSDFSEGMLDLARRKSAGVRWELGNALALPYGDGEFAAATVGFGARNFSDLDRGLAEMARVVRPGGRVVVLEITTPSKPPLSSFFSLWFDRVVPAIGRVAGDPDAYTYLPNSVKRFPGPQALGAALERAGLTRIRWVLTAGGIIALHVGTVPGGEGDGR